MTALSSSAAREGGTVVLLAYYHPPLTGVAAERAAALTRHLPGLGWRVVVISPARGFFHSAGPDRLDGPSTLPPSGVEVIRTSSVEWSRVVRHLWTRVTRRSDGLAEEADGIVTPVPTGSVGHRLRSWTRSWLYLPDAQRGWIGPAAAAARRALREVPGRRVLLSTSVPYSAHLAARRVARRMNVPWIAEFRDPWTAAHPTLRPSSTLRRRLDRRWEKGILNSAELVIHTSRSTRHAVLDAFPDLDPDRFRVVLNGFEPAAAGSPPTPDDPFLLLHAGTLAPGVDPAPILEAVEAAHRRIPGEIRLRHLGDPGPWRSAAGARWNRAPWLETPGAVTPADARAAMGSASANLLPLPGEAHRDRIPGKLLEYLGARRPILGIIPEGSEMEDIARRHGDLRAVRGNTPGEIEETLRRLLDDHRSGRLQSPRVPMEQVEPLSRRVQAIRLAALLDEVAR